MKTQEPKQKNKITSAGKSGTKEVGQLRQKLMLAHEVRNKGKPRTIKLVL
jgi:hypothetical protein